MLLKPDIPELICHTAAGSGEVLPLAGHCEITEIGCSVTLEGHVLLGDSIDWADVLVKVQPFLQHFSMCYLTSVQNRSRVGIEPGEASLPSS